ncbi:MAG TPA: hypothetical protein VK363_12820 [Pyrinomonadaceae bacterium]|nr:hypothetical protein [Pyrinomonadaceae bacterium]
MQRTIDKLLRLAMRFITIPMGGHRSNNIEEEHAIEHGSQKKLEIIQGITSHSRRERKIMSIATQALFAVAAIGAIVIGILLYYHKQTPTVWVTFASILAVTLAFCLQWQEGIWKAQQTAKSAPPPTLTAASSPTPLEPPKTLHDYFITDFNQWLNADYVVPINLIDTQTSSITPVTIVKTKLCLDFDANNKFLVFYIPNNPDTYNVCIALANQYKEIVAMPDKVGLVESRNPGDARKISSKELTFSGRVFIYHEQTLLQDELDKLVPIYKQKGLSPQFRGIEYAFTKNNPPAMPFRIPSQK